MVETLIRSDQRTEATAVLGSNRGRIWTMVVACMGVTLVIASMIALNTALGDIAVATSATQTQLTWVVDGYSWPWRVYYFRRVRSATGMAAALRCWSASPFSLSRRSRRYCSPAPAR